MAYEFCTTTENNFTTLQYIVTTNFAPNVYIKSIN